MSAGVCALRPPPESFSRAVPHDHDANLAERLLEELYLPGQNNAGGFTPVHGFEREPVFIQDSVAVCRGFTSTIAVENREQPAVGLQDAADLLHQLTSIVRRQV